MILHPTRDAWSYLKFRAEEAGLPVPAIEPNRFQDDNLDVIIEGHCRCTGSSLGQAIESADWYVRGIAAGKEESKCDSSVRL